LIKFGGKLQEDEEMEINIKGNLVAHINNKVRNNLKLFKHLTQGSVPYVVEIEKRSILPIKMVFRFNF